MVKHFFIQITLFLLFASIPSDIRGFVYEHRSDGCFTSIHVLTVDPKEHVILPVKALGKEITRETVATLAKRYGAIAAINGGFWKLDGSPAGILKINGFWHGTPTKPRGAIGWSWNGQKVLIDRVLTNYYLKDCIDQNEIEIIPMSTPLHTTTEEWNSLPHIVGGTPVLIKKGNIVQNYSPEQTLESFLIDKHPRTAVGIKDDGEWVFVVLRLICRKIACYHLIFQLSKCKKLKSTK